MTNKEREVQRAAKRVQHNAFGHTHTGEEWAKMLELSFDAFQYYIDAHGLTIEELYDLRGFKYREPKQKRGARMDETRERLSAIFAQSGYSPEELTFESKPGAPIHVVRYEGRIAGRYYYKENRLVLNCGEGVFLDRLEPERVKVLGSGFVWTWHPDTRAAIIDNILSSQK